MSQRDDASEIQLPANGNQAKMIGAPRDVCKVPGQPPPGFPIRRIRDSTGQAGAGEFRAKMTDIFQVVVRPPESAVDSRSRQDAVLLPEEHEDPQTATGPIHRRFVPSASLADPGRIREQSRTFGLAYTGKYIDMMVQRGLFRTL